MYKQVMKFWVNLPDDKTVDLSVHVTAVPICVTGKPFRG